MEGQGWRREGEGGKAEKEMRCAIFEGMCAIGRFFQVQRASRWTEKVRFVAINHAKRCLGGCVGRKVCQNEWPWCFEIFFIMMGPWLFKDSARCKGCSNQRHLLF